MRHNQRGFSLIELLIVVAIILIIAAIAIPNFLRSRIAANQASAIESMRTITTAEVTYSTTFGVGYATSLSVLGPPPAGQSPNATAAGVLDDVLASGAKSGYTFTYSPGEFNQNTNQYYGYTVTAVPSSYGQTGSTYYYTDQTGVIRGNTTTTAGTTDTAVAD